MGTPVEITAETSYWRQVQSPDPYKAWCLDMGLVEMDKDQLMAYIAAPKYICTAFYSHVLSAPDEKSDPVSDLVCGDLLLSCDPENSIFSVTDDIPETAREKTIDRRDTSGKRIARSWKHRASGEYLDVWLPSGIHGYVKATDIEPFAKWAMTRTPDARHILAQAAGFAGVPYQWGGTSSKGVDCSGFTRMVWFMNGILLPRNASQQARCGEEVTVEMRTDSLALCGALPEEEMKEEMLRRTACLESGDLIFFGTPATPGQGQDGKGARISHVGIYIGGGRFIHASRKVRYSSLIPGDPDYYDLSWKMIAARRIIGQEDKGNGVISILSSPAYFIQEF
ncbi:MAG: C40 family peptidase [Bacteroidetes bacterium]|uniref:C40 family peptidase n=1 Tax=Candidatus Cryptobacteroides intestinigallinarum TaxID=2840767 RepID=A0A9D9HM17_9BACT|nr:C40 family peptidase [Candidatus Cryptobacteroides intestinigallinarum]